MTPEQALVSQTQAAWTQAHAAYWQVAAALIQAVLSAGAVFAVWMLQDRFTKKREQEAAKWRLEVVANSALWTLRLYRRMVGRARPGMMASDFPGIARREELDEAIRVLRSVEVQSLDDEILAISLLDLRMVFQKAASEIEVERTRLAALKAQNTAVDIHRFLDGHTTSIFNATASVERRVAELVGRPARETNLSTILTKATRQDEPLNF